jgi:hypothetical protein
MVKGQRRRNSCSWDNQTLEIGSLRKIFASCQVRQDGSLCSVFRSRCGEANRLSIDKLSDELYIQFNQAQQKADAKSHCTRRTRKLAACGSHSAEGVQHDLPDLPVGSDVEILEGSEHGPESEITDIPTMCLPVVLLDEEKVLSDIIKCTACGDLLDWLRLPAEHDEETQEHTWWMCRVCMQPYCSKCSDEHLNDETGMCYTCDTPELDVLSRMKRRKTIAGERC